MLRKLLDQVRLKRDLLRRRMAMWRWDGPLPSTGSFVDRVVFIRWDAKLGDAIVLSWVMRELKRQRPDLEITVITGPELERLFREGFGIDSVFLASKKHGWSQLPQIAQTLKHSRYVVHMSEIWRPRDLRFVRQVLPQYVVGLDDELEVINVKLGRVTQGWHFSERLLPWLEQLGMDTTQRQYWVPRNAHAQARLAQGWPEGRMIGFCPFGASKSRQLSVNQIVFFAEQVLAKNDQWLLLIVQPSQVQPLQRQLAGRFWSDRLLFRPTNEIIELCEQVARCVALISVDTSVVHIASGLRKPTLAIYTAGSADSDNFKSWHPNNPLAFCEFIEIGIEEISQEERNRLVIGLESIDAI